MTTRHTLARAVSLAGVGLHTGQRVTVTLRPGSAGTGIVFRRVDLPQAPTIPATLAAVRDAGRRTLLGDGLATVGTVEHLLAALAALGVDDLVVDTDGPEMPALDGSAEPFVRAIVDAGLEPTSGQVRIVRVHGTLEVTHGDSAYHVQPAAELTLAVSIQWSHPLIGCQRGTFHTDRAAFTRDIAAARTFGFAAEAETLVARGLACGASVENTIVLTNDGLVAGTLRWPDEFVRHKALDLVGDLALIGARVRAAISAARPSHRGNLALARALERQSSSKE